MKECQHGNWMYSRIFDVSQYYCYHGAGILGCYFINCQEDCPNFENKFKKGGKL